MKRYCSLITLLMLISSISAFASERLPIEAAPIEKAIGTYFRHPNMANANKLALVIPIQETPYLIEDDKALVRIGELIDNNISQLKSLIKQKKSHAIKSALLMQCFLYDHHVYNDISLSLGELATSNPALLLRHASSLGISPKLLSDIVSCPGICGEDEDICPNFQARLKSIKTYCKNNKSTYCSPMISAIKEGFDESCKNP